MSERSPRSRSYPDQVVISAILGHRAGYSQRVISSHIDVPRTTVRSWIYKMASRKPGNKFPFSIEPFRHDHYWVIESPNGPMSEGVCKVCFEGRQFHNSDETNAYTWARRKRNASGGYTDSISSSNSISI